MKLFFLLSAAVCSFFIACRPAPKVYDLRSESLDNHLAIDNVKPHFSIVYSGKSLYSQDSGYWKVRIWNQNGRVSEWSEEASFGIVLFPVTKKEI